MPKPCIKLCQQVPPGPAPILRRVPTDRPQADEIQALREGAALVDRSYLGRLAISGPQAREALSALTTNDIESLEPGTGCFAACCTPKGRMLGELRVLFTGDELAIDMERISLQPVFDLIRHGLVGYDAALHKRTLESSQLSLLGPLAREVAGAGELGEAEGDNRHGEIEGIGVLMATTDQGVDLICTESEAGRLRAALIARGAVPAGPELAELARVESGRPRYGVDLDETVIPQEAGLNERLVSFDKGCYVGQETIARLHYRGRPNRRLCLLALEPGTEAGAALGFDGRAVGRVTSVADSPARGTIGLALVRREAPDGAFLTVGDEGHEAEILGAAGS